MYFYVDADTLMNRIKFHSMFVCDCVIDCAYASCVIVCVSRISAAPQHTPQNVYN